MLGDALGLSHNCVLFSSSLNPGNQRALALPFSCETGPPMPAPDEKGQAKFTRPWQQRRCRPREDSPMFPGSLLPLASSSTKLLSGDLPEHLTAPDAVQQEPEAAPLMWEASTEPKESKVKALSGNDHTN